MADNKFSAHQKDDYEQFAIAFLKNLKYLDYELIEEDKRIAANEKYKDQQYDKQKDADKKDGKGELDQELISANCESTNQIFKTVVDDDEEMKKLRQIPEAFFEPFASSETDVSEATEKFHPQIKSMHKKKKDTIEHCMKILKVSEEQAELESIKKVEEFKSHLKRVLKICEEEKEEIDILEEHETQLLEKVQILEDDLIEIEMNLQVNLIESMGKFTKTLENVTNDMKKRVGDFILEVTEAVQKFFDTFTEEAKKKMEQIEKQMEEDGEEDINEEDLPNECLQFLDSDPLKQSLDQSKEQIEGKVAGIETEIHLRLAADKDSVVN